MAEGDKLRDPVADATKLVSQLKISIPTAMAHNVEPGKFGHPFPVQTNAFGVVVEKETTIYVNDIRIFADLSPTKQVEFTKKGKEDCLVNDRKEKCVHILTALIEQNRSVFPDNYRVYYDGQSMLFTLDDVFKGNSKEGFQRFVVPGNMLKLQELKTIENVIVEIKACTPRRSFVLNSENVCSKTANLDASENDRYLTQFVEIALKQYAIMHPHRHKVYEYGKSFMTNPLREDGIVPNDIKEVGDGKILMVGSKQSIRQIEGPRGRNTNNMSLVVDAKKAAFHMEMSIIDKAAAIIKKPLDRPISEGDREKISGVCKGLFVETTHLKNNKRLAIFGLSKSCAKDSFFESEGKKVSVEQYFSDKYGMTLKFPNAPLILAKERGNVNCYPMEILNVIAYQRVTIPQQTPEQSQQSTRECAVPPAIRQRYIMAGTNSLELLSDNPYIKNVGIKVFPQPIKVNGRSLPSPAILYGQTKSVQVDFGKWRTAGTRYVTPSTITIWAVYMVQDRRTNYTVNDLKTFAKTFYDECKKHGMNLQAPADVRNISEADVEPAIKLAAESKCQFILFVVADNFTNFHKNMKYYERKYECTTQQIKLSNMEKIMKDRRFMTLENIINKTNVKLGGLNYFLDVKQLNGVGQKWFTDHKIVLGISMSHPPPSAAFSGGSNLPTVVGYAANWKACPYEFIGDFTLQDARKCDTLYCMADILKQVVERHKASHKGVAAKELLIYRSGIDEGSFEMTLKQEIPIIKATLKNMGVDIKIAFVVAAKTNSDVRLMKETIDAREKPTAQNIHAGVVVDQNLTHPAFFEFYLNSHTTLQGSAKTPRYTVLFDELGMTGDDIQGLTFTLAHNHQIIALTTSLPCPLYVAQRYAERGQALYTEYTIKEDSSSDNSTGFDDAIRHLVFGHTQMGNNRVTA